MNRSLAIIAAVGILIIGGLVVSLAVVASSRETEQEKDVCFTRECYETASRIKKNLDPGVKPCDNFYNFACGGYLASTPVPNGDIHVSPFSMLDEVMENKMRMIFEEPGSPDEAKHFKLVRTLYKTCINTSAIEKAGSKSLRRILDQFGKWPVVDGNHWREDDFNWLQSIYKARSLGYDANQFISSGITIDWRDNTKYMLMLDQPSFGLSRDILVRGKRFFIVKAYFDFMVDIAVLLGADKQRAIQELGESLDFEIKLANVSLPEEERRNFTLLNNQMPLRKANKEYPIVDWVEYFNTMLPSTIRVDGDEPVMVMEPNFIQELEKLLAATPKRVQANYIGWRIVADSVEYLNENLRKRRMEYKSAALQNVVTSNDPRWKECLAILSKSALTHSLNALYVRRYFKEEARQKVVEMAADIRQELIKVLEKSDWMDDATKGEALEKAASMIIHVAYPIELLDDKELEKVYAHIKLHGTDFLGDILHLQLSDMDTSLELLRKPVNKNEWITHDFSTEVNAFYNSAENSIEIPAAILQGAFFSNDRPRYMNYGAMGFLIGHEMTHSFDAEGKQFDKNGNLVDWWTQETMQKYLEKAECMIKQYDNYTVESVHLNVDGSNTVSENMADNGGIQKAYLAYKESVTRNGPEPKLPGLDYTQDQLFWISAASIWCTAYRPETAQYELLIDVHSPHRFRVIGSFSNLPEFADAFECPVGSNMNPAHKCSVI